MSDTISRRAAINVITKWMLEYGGYGEEHGINALKQAAEEIKALPSAEPEQRWIPSGEKPPEKGSYLVWMPFAPPKHRITVAEYCGGYWSIKTPVSAWMPLPGPYQEGEQNE